MTSDKDDGVHQPCVFFEPLLLGVVPVVPEGLVVGPVVLPGVLEEGIEIVGVVELGAPKPGGAIPPGLETRNAAIFFADGGFGIAAPFGRKAIVMSWPSANRSAVALVTMAPRLADGDFHTFTWTIAALPAHFSPLTYTFGFGVGSDVVVVVLDGEVVVVDPPFPAAVVDVVVEELGVVVVVVVDEVTFCGVPGNSSRVFDKMTPEGSRKAFSVAFLPAYSAGLAASAGATMTTPFPSDTKAWDGAVVAGSSVVLPQMSAAKPTSHRLFLVGGTLGAEWLVDVSRWTSS
ncbi:MAG: hypothetical protein ACYDGN_00705 [Acidimicrobiales bacterium]